MTATGDYVFGQGSLDYLTNENAVAQAIKTKIRLLLGEWWEDTNDGFPLFQQALLQRNTDEGIQTIDLLVRDRILAVEEVSKITEFSSVIIKGTYKARIKVETIYGSIEDQVEMEVI